MTVEDQEGLSCVDCAINFGVVGFRIVDVKGQWRTRVTSVIYHALIPRSWRNISLHAAFFGAQRCTSHVFNDLAVSGPHCDSSDFCTFIPRVYLQILASSMLDLGTRWRMPLMICIAISCATRIQKFDFV